MGYKRLIAHPRRVYAVLSAIGALLLVGCGSISRSEIENQIQKDLNTTLAGRASLSTGTLQQPGGTTTASASVSCPKNASIKAKSVFYCTADVTVTKTPPLGADPANSTPQTQSESHKVKVTMLSDSKAKWEVQ